MTAVALGVGIAVVAVGLNLYALAVIATTHTHVRNIEAANQTLRASLAAQRRRTIYWRDRAWRAEHDTDMAMAHTPFGTTLADVRAIPDTRDATDAG